MCLLQDSLDVLESRKRDVKNTFMVVSLTYHHAILVRTIWSKTSLYAVYLYIRHLYRIIYTSFGPSSCGNFQNVRQVQSSRNNTPVQRRVGISDNIMTLNKARSTFVVIKGHGKEGGLVGGCKTAHRGEKKEEVGLWGKIQTCAVISTRFCDPHIKWSIFF